MISEAFKNTTILQNAGNHDPPRRASCVDKQGGKESSSSKSSKPETKGVESSQEQVTPDKMGDGEHSHQELQPEGQASSPLAYFCQGEDNQASNSSYCTVFFGPNKKGQCLVDSGNLVASAISSEFAEQMGIVVQRHDEQCPSALAPDGRSMEIIGRTGPLQFHFKGAPHTVFEADLVVIRNLSHQINLGKAWLTDHRALHDHARETVKLKRPRQHGWTTVQLRGPQEEPEEESHHFVYGQERVRIPAQSARYIQAVIPSIKETHEVIIAPVENSKCPALVAKSVSTVEGQKCMAAIFNPLDKAVFMEKWCRIGEAELVTNAHVLGAMQTWPCAEAATGYEENGEKHVDSRTEGERRRWLHKEFRLGESDVLSDNPKAIHEVENLLLSYYDVISQHKTDYGKTDLMELSIDLVPGARPFKGRCLPTNPKEEEDLWNTLQEWNRQGVTEPANSPWGAPLIPVRKKDGRLRWCVDFRKLNEVTVKDSYPLPLISSNLHKLGQSSIFSTLDGTGAYHNVPISEQDRPLTAFVSPFGQFQFIRMPFGLCNAPQAYSRLVEMILAGIDVRHVLAYIDDIIVHTNTIEEHMRVLQQVLEAHRRGGLKIAPAKSFLFRSKVDYLGHQVSQNGIEMIDSYVNLLLDWPKPTTPKQLATFLGKAGYYRQFIPSYGKIVACLEAEKKKSSLIWTPQMEKSFAQVKEAFRTKPILAFPDYNGVLQGRPFIVDSDWSQEGMAQSISQVQPGPDGLRERVIACHGRKCTSAERNYSSNKGETASFVDGLNGFEHMLRYAPFRARVDNRCLSYIKNLKKPTGIWCRWLELIESFQFDIEHQAGKKHANVDAMSRAPHLPPPSKEMEKRSASYLCTLTPTQLGQVEQLNKETLAAISREENPEVLPLSNKQIRQAQQDDPNVRKMVTWVAAGHKPTKDQVRTESWEVQQMCHDFESLYLDHGILYKKVLPNDPSTEGMQRLVLPESLRATAFYWAHADASAGHLGVSKTMSRMRIRFYFPGLYNWVEVKVQGCHRCLQKRGAGQRADMAPRNTLKGYPGARWSLDLVGPLPRTHQGNVYIMTAEDVFTRYPVAVAIPDKTASTVAKAFEQHVITQHGSCNQLLTDNAQELTGHIMQDVAKILGITNVATCPYNPNGNKIERFHRTLGEMLRTVVDDNQQDWDECLGACLLAYRTSVHNTTKMTPFFLMHGREAMLPVDVIFPRPTQEYQVATAFGVDIAERLDRAFAFVRDQQQKVIKRRAELAAPFKASPLKEGELVWYYTPRQQPGTTKKLTRGWQGPFKVVQVVSDVTYIIQPTGTWTDKRPKIPAVIHRLQRYHEDTATPSPRTEATEQELVEELVDKIDENLDSTGEVQIASYPEQHAEKAVKVTSLDDEDVDEIQELDVTGRNTLGGGRATPVSTGYSPEATPVSTDYSLEG